MKIKRKAKAPTVKTAIRKALKHKDKVISDTLDSSIPDIRSLLSSTKTKIQRKKEERKKLQTSTDDVMSLLEKF
jgi:uncharacterized protein YlxW (UPF0749 family)